MSVPFPFSGWRVAWRRGLALTALAGLAAWGLPGPAQATACSSALNDRVLSIACLSARVAEGVADAGERAALNWRLTRLGLEGVGNPRPAPRIETNFRIRPSLRGTNLVAEDNESGIEAGVAANWGGRAIVAPGQVLRFGIGASEGVEPITLDRRARQTVSICSQTALGAPGFFDLCTRAQSRLRRGNTYQTSSIRATLAHPVTISPTRQAVLRLGVERYDDLTSEFTQPRLHVGAARVDHRRGLHAVRLAYGLAVADEHTLHWRVAVQRKIGVLDLRSHLRQRRGDGDTSYGTGVSLGVSGIGPTDFRLGLNANQDRNTKAWSLSPGLGFDYRF